MKKAIRWCLVGIVLYLVIFFVDYSLAIQDKTPVFALETVTYKDGGTKVYLGLGYKIIRYHVIDGRQDTDFGTWFIQYNHDK